MICFALAALRGQELIELAPLLVVLQLLFLFFLASFFLDLLTQLRLVLLLFPVTTMMGERGVCMRERALKYYRIRI